MQALLVIDVQNVIVNFKDFSQQLSQIERVINDFKAKNLPVIFIRNVSANPEDPFHHDSEESLIYPPFEKHADYTVEKQTPSSFLNTTLDDLLKDLGVNQLMITGFNTEFCCMFTAIAAFDRGYKVTFLEDAIGTVNDSETYDMEGLDINDFVSTALHWSNVIEVIDFEEYEEEYFLKE